MKIISSEDFVERDTSPQINYLYAGYVTTDESWRQQPLYASYSRLYYISEGSGILVSEQGSMPLEAGYVYIVPCGMKVGFYGTPSVTKLFFHINISFDEKNDAFENYCHFSRLPRSVKYINELKEMYLSNSKKDRFMLKSEISATICEFLSRKDNRNISKNKYCKNVSDAIAFIRKNIRATLTVKEVSSAVACSANTLAGSFKKELGQSISNYIEEIVMSEAQAQLLYTDNSIREISESLGYCDQFYFSRRFKNWFSSAPTEYRRQSK